MIIALERQRAPLRRARGAPAADVSRREQGVVTVYCCRSTGYLRGCDSDHHELGAFFECFA
jgi:hypothetical protein